MTKIEQVMCTAKARTMGGGTSHSDDDRLDVIKLALPPGRMIMSAHTVPVHQGVIGSEPD